VIKLLLFLPILPLGILAAEGDSGLPPWVNYGVLGLLIVAIILKQFVPGWLYVDVKKENEELRAENRRLVDLNLQTQASTGPALVAATSAIQDILTEVRFLKRGSAP
jgi:hypothetical protein